METKDALLQLLADSRGSWFSGEEIAGRLSLSRTAVWKAVNRLRMEGYQIEAVRNRGYRLGEGQDVLSEEGIRRFLEQELSISLAVFSCLDSTNTRLREMAAAGAPEGTVLVAGQQTQGRGRMGRCFFSPADTGLYLSLLLRPGSRTAFQGTRVTTMAAVAVCEAIEAVCQVQPEIRWVNDILLRGRKVCGILTEAAVQMETNSIDYAVLGIGINVYPPEGGFPPELRETAGAILGQPKQDIRNRLAAAILERFLTLWRQNRDYVDEYRRRNMIPGKQIRVISPAGHRNARALDIDQECRLVVRFEDGTVEALSSREISVRPES